MAATSAGVRFGGLFREALAQRRSAVVGMVHVLPLPGAPKYGDKEVEEVVECAVREARTYRECGVDGIIVENMHDTPYLRGHQVGPEVTACMTRVCVEVRQTLGGDLPLGVQILSGANREALAVAKAAQADFVRVEGFVFSHVGDEGWTDSCAGDLLRYRRNIAADNVLVFTDIKKKHSSHAVTSDISLTEMAQAAEFFQSDGVIVTGRSTGSPTSPTELEEVRASTTLPVLVGSGVTAENVEHYCRTADGMIIGSWFKEEGKWFNPLSSHRVSTLMEKLHTFPQPQTKI